MDIAAEALARLGKTDEEIADSLGISVATLNNWKREKPSFLASISRGKEDPDDQAEKSLFKLVTGFEITETTLVGAPSADGKMVPQKIQKTTRVVPPNVTAIGFWLKNRRPRKWRDKIEFSGSVEHKLPMTIEEIDAEIERVARERKKRLAEKGDE